ncbi:hypothetical protein V6N11_077446 [Hibiscus sabdariffa]|uniref:Uncharacterized protein n=1 Tax=Hibiscus sabdariffa TaxID=183260 RepID=A0ABR2TDU8_9ROSI
MTGSGAPCAIHKVFGASNVSKLLAHLPVVSLQAQLASLKEQAAQGIVNGGSVTANPNGRYHGKVPSQFQDVQSWFHSENPSMAPNFNPVNSYCENNGFSDPNSLANYENSVSSSGEDHVWYATFGQASHSMSSFDMQTNNRQWGFQEVDDLQSMAFGYAPQYS